jgi:hypothetical protein
MGIPGAWKYLKQFPEALIPHQSPREHILIDMNCILHRAAPFMKHAHDLLPVKRILKVYLNYTRPVRSFFIFTK